MKNIISAILFCIVFLWMSGCNEQPTELGYRIDSVSYTAISSNEVQMITDSKSQKIHIPGFNQGSYLIGQSGEHISYSIFRYGNIDSLEGAEIISAELNLINNHYAFGDTSSSGNQSFEIYEVQKGITQETTWDSLFAKYTDSEIFKEELMGSFNGAYSSIEDTLKINLNTQLIDNWIEFSLIEDSLVEVNDERIFHSYSIGLKPTENSNVINSFSSDFPGSSGPGTPNPFIKVIYNKEGNLDTVNLRSNITAYFADGPNPEPNSLTVQAGISTRGQIRFDISDIPEHSSIVKSVLKIYTDDSKTLTGNQGRDSVISAVRSDAIDVSLSSLDEGVYLARRKEGTDYYEFPSITSAVETWLKDDKRGSLLINYFKDNNIKNLFSNLDSYYLYGVEADSSKRPVLTIFYAKRPDFE